jgi:hypothetical protein
VLCCCGGTVLCVAVGGTVRLGVRACITGSCCMGRWLLLCQRQVAFTWMALCELCMYGAHWDGVCGTSRILLLLG